MYVSMESDVMKQLCGNIETPPSMTTENWPLQTKHTVLFSNTKSNTNNFI